MPSRTNRDFWVEMSVREIWTQAHFAGIAYGNINPKAQGGTDAVFSSIHSFLSHCAMVSKMLKASDGAQPPTTIGDVLGVPNTSVIHQRTFRNHLEHYDERLKRWIQQFGADVRIGTYNIGPKSQFHIAHFVFVSHYDPHTHTFTFVNDDFDLLALNTEVQRIKQLADTWVKNIENGLVSPPCI